MPDPLRTTRNVGIIAHIDAGKTTTTERMLYYAHLEHRLGSVDDGTTVTDWMMEERKRGITITAADVTVPWNGHRINIIDTPGHVDFTAEVERSLRVLDGAVVIFDAVAGVQAQSETVWRQADRYRIPRVAYINKMDRLGADFDRAVESIRTRLGATPLPIQMPLGAAESFRGVIDLVTMTCRFHDPDTLGAEYTDEPIPEEAQELAHLGRDEMLHALADYSDTLMEKYLDDQPIEPDEVRAALRAATLAPATTGHGAEGEELAAAGIVPVLCGSSLHNIGVQALADAICAYLPSPLDIPPVQGTHPKTGDPIARKPEPKGHPAAVVFKVAADQHGDLFYLRVYSGTFTTGKNYQNPRTGDRERILHLYRMYANDRQALDQARAGEIVAVTGLKSCATGDTLCDPKHPILLGAMAFPETVISMAIEPKTSDARERLNEVLERLEREDPTFRRRIDPDTGQTIISGMGELHLEVLKHRMLTDFNVDANIGKPRVTYKETIRQPVDAEAEHHAPADPTTRAIVALHLDPIAAASSTTDAENVVAERAAQERGARGPDVQVDFAEDVESILPRQVQEGVAEAVESTAAGGALAGYPLVRVRATVTRAVIAGTEDPDPRAHAPLLEAAAARALRAGAEEAGIFLLEPWMRFEIITPEAFLGDILTDLSGRRGEVERTDPLDEGGRGGPSGHLVAGKVPLSTMFGYATALRSLSQGRATFTMEPLEYLPVPDELAEKFLL